MAVKIQIRKSLKSEWELYNPTLAEGELGLETDTGYLKVGNGTDAWNSLEYWVPISATEIKSLYEGNSDTNAFTDALLSKLNGIEAGATQDQSAVEVPYDNVTSGLSATDTKGAIDEVTDRVGSVESNKQDILAEGAFEDGDKTKLNGIEAGATADQDAGEIKVLYENNPNTNAFTDAEKTKLDNTEVTSELDARDTANRNTDNHTDGTINGVYTLAERNKLSGIEANAKDDQISSEVPVTATGNLSATNVQLALEELQADIDVLNGTTAEEI